MHLVQLSSSISVSRASFPLDGFHRWVHKLKGYLEEECLLKHQGLVLCNCCLWTLVWNCQRPDSAAPAALNLLTSAGFECTPNTLHKSEANSFKATELGVNGLYPDLSEVGVWPLVSARL